MKLKIAVVFLCLLLVLTGCNNIPPQGDRTDGGDGVTPDESGVLGDDGKTFGEALEELDVYDGYFEGDSTAVTVTYVSGTKDAWQLEGNILTFTAVTEDTVYSVSGTLKGNIVIDAGDEHKLDVELCGFSLICDTTNPITVLSGSEVAIKAKKDTQNYIYDQRPAIDSTDETLHSGAIHSEVDLEIGGKGSLNIVSENNNGIHSKDDLQVKNLTLTVACIDNALKGNDSVEIEGGVTTLIASGGDGIKSSNSDISSKGNQRGTVTLTGGTHTIYAARDGIDAAYDAVINDTTTLTIYTDKYSSYSTETNGDVSQTPDNPQGNKSDMGQRPADSGFGEFPGDQMPGGDRGNRGDRGDKGNSGGFVPGGNGGNGGMGGFGGETLPENMPDSAPADMPNGGFSGFVPGDMGGNGGFGGFVPGDMGGNGSFGGFMPGDMGGNGGFGGMGGNKSQSLYSSKGIKADNQVIINGGNITIKSYDDAIHANNDVTLENGGNPLGNVTVNGGVLTLYSNDDGIHADGQLSITAGEITITNSYEGLEGSTVSISGGNISVRASDDGINGVATSGTAISISGGRVYIYCSGDGIDSNSRTSYSGIVFDGGDVIVISTSGGNSAIDSERGYTYNSGTVIALMPRGGMSGEATHCQSFSSVGMSTQLSLTEGNILSVATKNADATIKMPCSLSALVVVLGDTAPTIDTPASTNATLDQNGVAWN